MMELQGLKSRYKVSLKKNVTLVTFYFNGGFFYRQSKTNYFRSFR